MRPPGEKRTVIYTRENNSINFQPHHQPFNYFSRFAPGSPARNHHLRDGEDLLRDIGAGQLPSVVFYKPVGRVSNDAPSDASAVENNPCGDTLNAKALNPNATVSRPSSSV